MYIKGASRRSVGFWSKHLQNIQENDRAELIEKRGLASDNLPDMMREMEQDARLTRCTNFMYIASFNPCPHEHLTEEQWDKAYEIFEKQRGIPEGQARFVMEHEKHGRIHRHVVWSRIDLENMRAFPDGRNDNVCDAAKHEIERELGLERTAGLHEREQESAAVAPKSYEMYRGMKSGLDPRDITAEVTAIFRGAENGADFVEGLRQHGYQFVQGDRAFCILDPAGHDHSLARRLEGVNTKELRAFMQGVDLSGIPTVEQGKAQFRERQLAERQADLETVIHEIEREEALAKAAIEKEKIERRFVGPELERERQDGRQEKESGVQAPQASKIPELGRTAQDIRQAYGLAETGAAFVHALGDRGLRLAQMTAGDAEILAELEKKSSKTQGPAALPWMGCRGGVDHLTPKLHASAQRSYDSWWNKQSFVFEDYVSYTQQQWEKNHSETQERKPRYQEGDLVVVNSFGNVYGLTQRNTGATAKERAERLKDIDTAQLPGVADTRTLIEDLHAQKRQDRELPARAERPLHGKAADIRLAYSLSDSAEGFVKNLDEHGIKLAYVRREEADRSHRDAAFAREVGRFAPEYREGEYVAIDRRGHAYGLNRATTGEQRGDVEKFMGTLDSMRFRGIDSVRKQVEAERQKETQQRRDKEKILNERPLNETLASIRLAYSLSRSPDGLLKNLGEVGLRLAQVSKNEAERSHRAAVFAKEVGRFAPEYREGECVVITERGRVYSLNERTTGKSQMEIDGFMRTLDTTKVKDIEATRREIAGYKRPAPSRELWADGSQATIEGTFSGGLKLHSLTPAQQFGRATGQAGQRASAPDHVLGTRGDIWTAYERSDNARAFVTALKEKGIEIALVTKDDAANSRIDDSSPKERGERAPVYREGEFVAINDTGQVYRLNQRSTGQSAAKIQKFMEATLDPKQFQSIAATQKTIEQRYAERDLHRQAFIDMTSARIPKREIDPRPAGRRGRKVGKNAFDKLDIKRPAALGKSAVNTMGKALDVVGGAIESLFAPKLSPQQIYQGDKAARERTVEAESSQDFAQQQGDLATERRQREQDREAERQRHRELDRER